MALVCALFLFPVLSYPAAPTAKLVVTLWGEPDEIRLVQTQASLFERLHPDTAIQIVPQQKSYWTELNERPQGETVPDVMYFNSAQLPEYVAKGRLLDLESFLRLDVDKGELPFEMDDFYPAALSSFRCDGSAIGHGPIYGLPTILTVLGFYYNKTLFDRVGVPYPSDDWTWDEFEEKASAIAKLDGCWGAHVDFDVDAFRVYLWTYGLDFFTSGLDSLNVSDPRLLGRLEHWRDLRKPSSRLCVRWVAPGKLPSFFEGNVGLIGPVGRWMLPRLAEIRDFDWEFAQLPRGSERANMLLVGAWCITRGSKNPREAWAFVKFMASPECQRMNVRLCSPGLRSVANSAVFLDGKLKPARNDLFLAALERGRVLLYPRGSDFMSYMQQALDDVLVAQRVSPEEALAAVQERWNQEKTATAKLPSPIVKP